MKYLMFFLSVWAGAGEGHLVLMGGGQKPESGMMRFIELAGGVEAPIVVLPTASGDPATPDDYRDLFAHYGCKRVVVVPLKTRADAEAGLGAAEIARAGGLFFTGGDQRRITQALMGTELMALIQRRFDEGMVVGGTSAGTACMSSLMITGDGEFDRIGGDNVAHWEGLGLAQGVILDQHFVARGRQNRLLSMVLQYPDMIGVGVDEDTAIWVKPNQTFEVLGGGQVVVYSARGAAIPRPRDERRLRAQGVTLHVLIDGDHYDLKSGRVGQRKELTH